MLRTVAALAFALTALACPAWGDSAPIQDAIERAQKFLIDHQNPDGTWEHVPKPVLPAPGWGEKTALAVYALGVSGLDTRSNELTRAAKFVAGENLDGASAIGFRSECMSEMWGSDIRLLVRDSAARLVAGIRQPPAARLQTPALWPPGVGFYDDGPGPGARIDLAGSARASCGVEALIKRGAMVPDSYWRFVEAGWRKSQMDSGGWAETPGGADPSFKMTAAAVATLLTADDHPSAPALPNDSIARGMKWLDQHFETIPADPESLCDLFRISQYTGRRYLGDKDWKSDSVAFLIAHQQPDGSFPGPGDPVVNTSFALMFVAEANYPILMNKLGYTAEQGGQVNSNAWNERPYDVGHVTDWTGREFQRSVNWQAVELTGPPAELRDAPILYISGSQSLHFKTDHTNELRRYVEEGGLLLGNANAGSGAFGKSFIALGSAPFPKAQWKQTDSDDFLFTEMFKKFHKAPKVLQLSNGVRKLMLLIPDADVSLAWQSRPTADNMDAFQLAGNLVVYSSDHSSFELQPDLAVDSRVAATRSLKVARLMIGSNPDPEPAGWRRLAVAMHNQHKVDLQVESVKAENVADYKVAHLTGVGPIILTPAERDALGHFVQKGGTLIVDAAGGNAEFARSMEAELKTIFPDATLEQLGKDDAIYTTPGVELDRWLWRRRTQSQVPDRRTPLLRAMDFDQRHAVFFSPEDLSAGLVGQQVDGIYGYAPEAATHLMESMLLYASK